MEIDFADRALACAVRVEAREPLAGEKASLHRRGRRVSGRGPHVERHGRKIRQIDVAGDVIAEGCAAFVGLEQRFIENHLHGDRGERGQVEDLDIDFALDLAGDHRRSICKGIMCACAPRTPRMADSRSCGKCADGDAGVDDLEGVQGRGESGDDVGRGHGQRNRPGAKNGMTAGEQLLGVDVGDGAGGGDLKIAANQLHADGGTGLERGVRGSGRMRRERTSRPGQTSPPPATTGSRRGSGGLLLPETDRFGAESAHHQRSFHRLEGHVAGGSRVRGGGERLMPGSGGMAAESRLRLAGRDRATGMSRTSSICSMGVMPAMGSLANWPMR